MQTGKQNKKDSPGKLLILNCPECNSDNIIKMNKIGYAVMLSILLFALPLPIFKKNYYCYDCENEWKIK